MKYQTQSQFEAFSDAVMKGFEESQTIPDVIHSKPAASNCNNLLIASSVQQPIYGYMRQRELLRLVPFSAATLWRRVKSNNFVKPVKLSVRITAWSRTEVYAWLQKQGESK